MSVLHEVLVDLVELLLPDLDEGELVEADAEGAVDRVEQLLKRRMNTLQDQPSLRIPDTRCRAAWTIAGQEIQARAGRGVTDWVVDQPCLCETDCARLQVAERVLQLGTGGLESLDERLELEQAEAEWVWSVRVRSTVSGGVSCGWGVPLRACACLL